MMDIAQAKKNLRHATLHELRAEMSAAQREEESAQLRQMLAPLLKDSAPLTIALYAPQEFEVQILPLLQEYPQHRYAFPRCLPAKQLVFHEVHDAEHELKPAEHGIPAPNEAAPRVEASELDIIIVPGLAFTPQGARLGFGGGYYDRFLPQCPHAKRIALAYARQLKERIPCDEHDQSVHIVLSASGL